MHLAIPSDYDSLYMATVSETGRRLFVSCRLHRTTHCNLQTFRAVTSMMRRDMELSDVVSGKATTVGVVSYDERLSQQAPDGGVRRGGL